MAGKTAKQTRARKSAQKNVSTSRTSSVRKLRARNARTADSKALEKSTDKQRFVDDLLIRGDAAEPDAAGNVARSATHVIKKRKPSGSAEVERVRFKYV